MKELQVIKSEMFGKVECDFYRETEKDEILMTREQVGMALGYGNPETAIKNIHLRNKDRLDRFSTKLKLSQVEGNRTVSRDVILYTSKGVYEICRYSRQPKADDFMDWVWEVVDSIRKTGSYSIEQTNQNQETIEQLEDRIEFLEGLLETRYTPFDIARELRFESVYEMNMDLVEKGIQYVHKGKFYLFQPYASYKLVEFKEVVTDIGGVLYEKYWTENGRNFLLSLYKTKGVRNSFRA